MDALCSRYGKLLQALDPQLAGLALFGSDLGPRGAWGEPLPDLTGPLRNTGWAAAPPPRERVEAIAAGPQIAALLLPLISDSGRLVGVLALRYPTGPTGIALSDLAQRPALQIAPALECMRQELASSDAAARATELSLLRMANQLDVGQDECESLDSLLDACLRRSGSERVVLVLPKRGLLLQRSVGSKSSPSVAAELPGIQARLTALSGQLRRPLVINGPSDRADRSAACRMLITPLRCCNGRVEAAVAYLNPLESVAYSASHTLIAQSGGAALSRALETGFDRYGLYSRVGLEAVVAGIKTGTGSLILVDIDRLHVVNGMHGFACGDRLIQQLAELLNPPLLPANAYAARLHGGCFALLLPGRHAQEAAELATALQNAAGALVLDNASAQSRITLSCGVAEIANLSEPLSKALVSAEVVMRLAKERGRSRIEIHVSENSSIIRRHDEVYAAADLREALRTGQLVLFAQRIVSLKDPDAAPGFELLARLRDSDGNFKSPNEFMAAAQRYQLLPAIDRYVVERAFSGLAPHRSLLARLRASVSINISGQSVGDPAFVDFFIEQLRESKLPPGVITVEITEQAAVYNLERAGDMMRRLRAVGCGIALDDFGTGANSLAYLRSMPITRIKIDGSFVRDLLTNSRSEAAIRGIVQLAKGFNLDSVAEFVESALIANKLRHIGVEHGQGFYFGKPEPMEQSLAALDSAASSELRDMLNQ